MNRMICTLALLAALAAAAAAHGGKRSGAPAHAPPRAKPACDVETSTFFSVDPTQFSMCVSRPEQVRAVFENHFVQTNKCSVSGLKRERAPETQLFFGPTRIAGEEAVDDAVEAFCRPLAQGGFRGIQFREVASFIVGNTISVRWEATAPFLARPYAGSEAYVTCGNKILTFVSSFDPTELEFKPWAQRLRPDPSS